MKSLKNFIEEYGVDNGCRMLQRAEQLESYFDMLPEGFEDEPYKDWILEALVSHDKEKVQKALTKKFDIKYFGNTAGRDGKDTSFSFNWEPEWSTEKEELEKLLDFFGWYVTVHEDDLWVVSPKWAENCTDYIQKECKGFVYHICKNINVDSILKNGLRCKKGDYREFPERIYLVAAPPKNVRDAVKSLVTGELRTKYGYLKNYCILKIKISNEVYRDDIMASPYTFYTYTNIPAKNIVNKWNLDEFVNPEGMLRF